MKDTLDQIHLSLDRRSLAMAKTMREWAAAACFAALAIAAVIGAAWQWQLRCLTRESRVSQVMVAADAHNAAISAMAMASNGGASFGLLMKTATARMNGIGDDVKRNLDILGGSQNEFRHLIGSPARRDGMFATMDRFNALIGDPEKRTGMFKAQDDFDTLLVNMDGPVKSATKLIDAGRELIDNGNRLLTGDEFKRLLASTDMLLLKSSQIAGHVEIWTKNTIDPDPYKGNHPTWHKVGIIGKDVLGLGRLTGEPIYYWHGTFTDK